MAPPSRPPIPFSFGSAHPDDDHGFVLTTAEYQLIADAVAPFHGSGNLRPLLDRAVPIAGGYRITAHDDALVDLLEAVAIEASGFLRVQEENAGKPLRRPKPGGHADRLKKLYAKLDDYLA